MIVQLTARFAYKGGSKYKKVTWVEKNPRVAQKDKETQEVVREIPLTDWEVKQEYRRLFVKYMNEGKAVSLEDADGKVFIIHLGEVCDIELDSEKLSDEVVEGEESNLKVVKNEE